MTDQAAHGFEIRAVSDADRVWVSNLLTDRWASVLIVTRGKIHDASKLPAFLAIDRDRKLGLVTYRIDGRECEVISLDSLQECTGVGSTLIERVAHEARNAGCTRLWLITTNDNLHAVRFYQKRGFVLVSVHRNAIAESRKIKPSIPETGIDGIPIRDEIEMEQILTGPGSAMLRGPA